MNNIAPIIDTVGSLRALRLDPEDHLCWAIWPAFEARLKLYSTEVAPDTPVELFIPLLRRAFVENNPLYFIMIIINDEDEIVGHCIGWHEQVWGKNYALIHQAKLDVSSKISRNVWLEIRIWIHRINSLGCNPPISSLRFVTTRGDGWYRRLKGKCEFERSVLFLTLDHLNEVCEAY